MKRMYNAIYAIVSPMELSSEEEVHVGHSMFRLIARISV